MYSSKLRSKIILEYLFEIFMHLFVYPENFLVIKLGTEATILQSNFN